MTQVAGKLARALAAHQSGDFSEAERRYRAVLRASPAQFDAVYGLGALAAQARRFDEARRHLDLARRLRPDSAEVVYNLGVVQGLSGDHARALESYCCALRLRPGYFEAWRNRGRTEIILGDARAALAAFDAALALRPDDAELNLDRADALYLAGSLAPALAAFERVLGSREVSRVSAGRLGSALAHQGALLRELGRLAEAVASLDAAIMLSPQNASAHASLGAVLLDLKRPAAALESIDLALKIGAESSEGALGLEARSLAEIHSNRGNALLDLQRRDEALDAYERALELDPGHPATHFNRAVTLGLMGRHGEAARAFERLLEAHPDTPWAHGELLHARLHECDWRDLDVLRAGLADALRAGRRAALPFAMLCAWDDPADHLRAARMFVQDAVRPASTAVDPARHVQVSPGCGDGRIRLAYLSADFRDHPVARIMAGLFERHDRSRFEVMAYSFGTDDGSDMRRRMEAAFDRFVDVRSLGDGEVAQLMRGTGIDIAVDLMGHTRGARPGIFAARCAPVQVLYPGGGGTSGAPWMDYLIADRFLAPPGAESDYSERLVRLPVCFQVNDDARPLPGPAPSRGAAGLPEHGFVFCCFNANYKIQPEMFAVWMRLLAQVEGSVLWLLAGSEAAMANLRDQAGLHGVDPGRMCFAPRVPAADHLARHALADLFLDTAPVNAGATASDALWAGLPVLTLAGRSLVSRACGSLLQDIGLGDLVTLSIQEYEALALHLARNPERLDSLRQELIARRGDAPLFDTERFRRHVEAAYLEMWRRAGAGELPSCFDVAEQPGPASHPD